MGEEEEEEEEEKRTYKRDGKQVDAKYSEIFKTFALSLLN